MDAVLFNGGSLHAAVLRQRVLDQIAAWQDGARPIELENAEPDLAVARGAARFGKLLHGHAGRIAAGAARAVFLPVQMAPAATNQADPPVLQYCVEKLMSKIVGLRVKLSEGYRGKTQWLDLSIQWLLKLCPCFAGARIPIFDLCGVRRSRRDLRHDSAGLRRLRQFIGR